MWYVIIQRKTQEQIQIQDIKQSVYSQRRLVRSVHQMVLKITWKTFIGKMLFITAILTNQKEHYEMD